MGVPPNIWFPIVAALFITFAASFVFIRTMRWVAAYVFWGFIGLLFTLGIIGIIALLVTTHLIDDPEQAKNARMGAYIGSGIISMFLLIAFIGVFCFRHKIKISIELVKEGSRAVCCSHSSIFLPIIPFIIRTFFIIITGFFCFAVFTNMTYKYSVKGMGDDTIEKCRCNYVNDDECTPEQFNKDCSANGTLCFEASCSMGQPTFPWTAYLYWVSRVHKVIKNASV